MTAPSSCGAPRPRTTRPRWSRSSALPRHPWSAAQLRGRAGRRGAGRRCSACSGGAATAASWPTAPSQRRRGRAARPQPRRRRRELGGRAWRAACSAAAWRSASGRRAARAAGGPRRQQRGPRALPDAASCVLGRRQAYYSEPGRGRARARSRGLDGAFVLETLRSGVLASGSGEWATPAPRQCTTAIQPEVSLEPCRRCRCPRNRVSPRSPRRRTRSIAALDAASRVREPAGRVDRQGGPERRGAGRGNHAEEEEAPGQGPDEAIAMARQGERGSPLSPSGPAAHPPRAEARPGAASGIGTPRAASAGAPSILPSLFTTGNLFLGFWAMSARSTASTRRRRRSSAGRSSSTCSTAASRA